MLSSPFFTAAAEPLLPPFLLECRASSRVSSDGLQQCQWWWSRSLSSSSSLQDELLRKCGSAFSATHHHLVGKSIFCWIRVGHQVNKTGVGCIRSASVASCSSSSRSRSSVSSCFSSRSRSSSRTKRCRCSRNVNADVPVCFTAG